MITDLTDVGSSTILVVDDEDRNIKLLETLLQVQGYKTVSATSGADALVKAAAEKPDLILLDIMMPQGRFRYPACSRDYGDGAR